MRFQFVPLVVAMAVIAPTSVGATAPRNEGADVALGFAARTGQILGAAMACQEVARPRIKSMNDELMEALKSTTSSADEFNGIKQIFFKSVAEGQRAVANRQTDCVAANRALAELESFVASSPGAAPVVAAQPQASTAPSVPPILPTTPLVQRKANISAQGVNDDEIRFGISAPFSGTNKELGHHMKLGIEAAFNEANSSGGVHGRRLRLISADDGYEPARTAETMKQLYETDQIFGAVGNVGTPTAAVALPFALERRMLFYGAFTGADLLRRVPPDRYVFNFRASYAEETEAVVGYLMKLRRLQPEQIAVFAQQDAYGDAGVAGVAKSIRASRSGNERAILRLNYKRNTVDVEDAVARLRQSRVPIKAVVMVATYRAAAKFIEKTRDAFPAMIYTNVSFVGSTALAEELMLLGPRFANGVIVTQVVPAVEGYSSVTLDYKAALAAYFPGETADYVSLEGYLAAKVLVEALKRAGPQVDTEKVVDALESLRDFDLGLGAALSFSRTEHQGLHKVWGTQLDANGHYQPIELQ